MIFYLKRLSITFVILLTSVFCLTAQNEIPTNNQERSIGFYLSPKIGIAEIDNDMGFLSELEIGLIKNRIIYSVFFDNIDGGFGGDEVNSIGLTYGRNIGNKYVRFQYQGGFSYIVGEEGASNVNGFGIPVLLNLIVLPSKYLGVGVNVISNFNTHDSYFGPSISLYLGKLRQ